MPLILDGKKLSETLKERMKHNIAQHETKPGLVIIQIGDIAESNIYIKYKIRYAKNIGARVVLKKYKNTVTESEVIADIQKYNQDTTVHGILVQLPIPKELNKNAIIESILPTKDVDGLTATNVKHLYTHNTEGIIPATTRGILTLLEHYNISVPGKKVVVVGRSTLVGKATALAFLNQDATVTICHSHTKNLEEETKQADILIVAIGTQKFITEKYVREGQVIIDVGINTEEDSRVLSGDVDYEHVEPIVSAITPVPGGVGPMTIASLFQNLFQQFIHNNSSTNRNI
jgi:methylenetetrahydrofolate dehydrogenase (NADP+) / methenyltetrahydrofolate cyclohydrolase